MFKSSTSPNLCPGCFSLLLTLIHMPLMYCWTKEEKCKFLIFNILQIHGYTTEAITFNETWGSHSGKNVSVGLLGCNTT
jgi:hypothetical protein